MNHLPIIKLSLVLSILALDLGIYFPVQVQAEEKSAQNSEYINPRINQLNPHSTSDELWQRFRQQQDELRLQQQQRLEQFRIEDRLRQQQADQFRLDQIRLQQRQQMDTLRLQQQLRN